MSKKKNKATYNPPISMFNWFFTLLLSILPGVNILFFILGISFAQSPTKRSFCLAALVLSLLLIAAIAIAVWFFSPELVDFFNSILPEAKEVAAAV